MEEQCYKVSEITDLLKEILEGAFPSLAIEGEISNFRPSAAGHCYFTLKDERAMISAVLFRGQASRLDFKPEDGQKVIARGRLSVYGQRGNYQIICESLSLAGRGSILAMLEERKKRLAAEGLFDEDRKQSIPAFPETVAVITSPTGAAVRDILRVIRRRNSGIKVIILPAVVQGEGAGKKIATQIKRVNDFNLADVIITGRGGGSLEDLLPFSDESVVRAISDSHIPVISAVGHEIDFALSDFAADLRAATPSAAAELVSSMRNETEGRILYCKEILSTTLFNRLDQIRNQLKLFSKDEMERSFLMKMQPLLLRLDDAKEQLVRGMNDGLNTRKHTLEILTNTLEQNSPVKTLARGFAYISDKSSGEAVSSVKDLKKDQNIAIQFHDGEAAAQIKEIRKK